MDLAISILIQVIMVFAWFMVGYTWAMRQHYKKLSQNAGHKLQAVEALQEATENGKIEPEDGMRMIVQFFSVPLEEWTLQFCDFFNHELDARIKANESEGKNVKPKRGRPAGRTSKATV